MRKIECAFYLPGSDLLLSLPETACPNFSFDDKSFKFNTRCFSNDPCSVIPKSHFAAHRIKCVAYASTAPAGFREIFPDFPAIHVRNARINNVEILPDKRRSHCPPSNIFNAPAEIIGPPISSEKYPAVLVIQVRENSLLIRSE